MKTIATAAMDAINAGEALVTGAIEITPRIGGTVLRLWGGYGPITFGGHTYKGLGDQAIVQRTSNAIGGVAQGLTLLLSGIEPAALALLDPAEVKGSSNVLYRLIFGSDGKNLLDYAVFDRGRGDALTSDETIGGQAAISYAVESAARGLGRSGARQRSDNDQRLIDPDDGYFKNTAYAGQKMLYWAGKKPSTAGQAVIPSPPSVDFSG
jgi:hypothetical protein